MKKRSLSVTKFPSKLTNRSVRWFCSTNFRTAELGVVMLFTNQKLPADLKLVGVKTRGAVIGQFESDPVRVRVISLESLDGED